MAKQKTHNVSNHAPAQPKHALSLLIVFCIPVLLYLQTVSFGFTQFDDDRIITNNYSFLSDVKNIPQAFTTSAFIEKTGPLYRPLQTVSYIVDAHIGTNNHPWMFHLSNVLLLGCIACALFMLLMQFLIPPMSALFGTVLFCVHPLFVSAVPWIPARGDLLLALFSLLSFVFLIEYLHKQKPTVLFYHLITFTIALFCKETAAVLPLLFISYYLCFSEVKPVDSKQVFTVIMYILSGALWFWLRFRSIDIVSNKDDVFGLPALVSNIRTIPESLAVFFLPFPTAPIPSFSVVKTITGLVIIGILSFFFFKNKERTIKEKLFCIAWFALLMFPPMLFKGNFIDYLQHRFFLPLIGILLLLLFMFPQKWLQKGDSKMTWILVVIIVLLSSLSFVQSRSYANPLAFYNAAVSQNDQSALAHSNRAVIKSNNGDNQGALDDYNYVITNHPKDYYAYYNRGVLKLSMGDKRGAIADFDCAIVIRPNYSDPYFGKGNAHNDCADFNAAIDDFTKAIAVNPNCAQAYNNRGNAKNNSGDKRGALDDFTKAISLLPNYLEAYYNRGNLKLTTGDKSGAEADFDHAIALCPSYPDAYYGKGNVNSTSNDFKAAINNFTKAITLNPNYAQAYNNRGDAKKNSGDKHGALEDYSHAIALDSGFSKAYNNMGTVLGLLGNFAEAISNFDKAIAYNNNYRDAYSNRAMAKYYLHDYTGAILDCEKVLMLHPNDEKGLSIKAAAQKELQKTVH